MINCYSVSLWKRRGVKTADHTSKHSDTVLHIKWFLSTNSFILPCLSPSEEATWCSSLLWLAPVSRTCYVISYAWTSSKTMNMNCTVDTPMTKHPQEKTPYSRNSANFFFFKCQRCSLYCSDSLMQKAKFHVQVFHMLLKIS